MRGGVGARHRDCDDGFGSSKRRRAANAVNAACVTTVCPSGDEGGERHGAKVPECHVFWFGRGW